MDVRSSNCNDFGPNLGWLVGKQAYLANYSLTEFPGIEGHKMCVWTHRFIDLDMYHF